jgi:hypothetical protein
VLHSRFRTIALILDQRVVLHEIRASITATPVSAAFTSASAYALVIFSVTGCSAIVGSPKLSSYRSKRAARTMALTQKTVARISPIACFSAIAPSEYRPAASYGRQGAMTNARPPQRLQGVLTSPDGSTMSVVAPPTPRASWCPMTA